MQIVMQVESLPSKYSISVHHVIIGYMCEYGFHHLVLSLQVEYYSIARI